MAGYDVAVVGATGLVGSTMIEVLRERGFPLRRLRALATARSAGSWIGAGAGRLLVEDVAGVDWASVELALFAGGEVASGDHVPAALEAGATVVDNSALYRMEPEVPLVVPEVNAHHLDGHRGLVANPNCSTIQLVTALAPLHREVPLKRIVVATYQSVSGTGKEALEELEGQVRAWAAAGADPAPRVYPHPIAFNLIPEIGPLDPDGVSGEEHKMVVETRKILGAPQLQVAVTCVRVPVWVGHSEAVHLEFHAPLPVARARALLQAAPGIELVEPPGSGASAGQGSVTPRQAAGSDRVRVGRLRQDPSVAHGLAMWVVADNLRKGAATNAVQIAEALHQAGRLARASR